MVNGEIEKMPTDELARDCIMPEGPPDNIEGMNQLLTVIPRDGDNNSELWTTVDKEKNNVRSRALMKLLKGFSMYVIGLATNVRYDGKVGGRFLDTIIVCNVLPSSGPPDLDGIFRRKTSMLDAFEKALDNVDDGHSRFDVLVISVCVHELHLFVCMDYIPAADTTRIGSKGAGQASGTARSKKKGDRPGHLDQKLWAPLHYCAFWNAGVFVSMMNKMGSWDMPINYAVKVSVR